MDDADAWSAYWAQMGGAGGCLPGAPAAVQALLAGRWRDFARDLPSNGAVVDLATGTGAVLRAIGEARPDLDLVGVDYARLPGPAPAGLRLIGETRIEALPFEDARFSGVASQFGFEYAERAPAIDETARIAAPGARLQLIVHHVDSPILQQNGRRRLAILASRDAGLIDLARRAAADGAAGDAFARIAADLGERYPDQMAVREIPAALEAAVRARSAGDIAAIDEGMAREVAIIDELLRVAQDGASIEALVDRLAPAFSCDAPTELTPEHAGRPIAWLVSGRRRG